MAAVSQQSIGAADAKARILLFHMLKLLGEWLLLIRPRGITSRGARNRQQRTSLPLRKAAFFGILDTGATLLYRIGGLGYFF